MQSNLFGGSNKQSFWDKNWHFLYFALAAFDIAAICLSLHLSHTNLHKYEEAIEYTNNKIKILELIGGVSESAQKVNAPGNDIFDSKNAAKEKEKYHSAKLDYDNKISALHSLIQANSATANTKNDLSETLEIKTLEDINLSMEGMNEIAIRIFVLFDKNEAEKAAPLMAEMDRRFAKLNQAIEDFRRLQRDQISNTLNNHHKNLNASKKFEIYFSFLILFAVFGITVFGKHLSRFVNASLINAQKNRAILEAVSNSAIVAFTDNKGKITEVNENFCKISGYTREELIGKDHRLLNSGKHPKSFFSEMWKNIHAGNSWSGDIENKKKTGEHYFVRSVISPIRGTSGSIEQFFAIRFDVTKQKQSESELVAALEFNQAICRNAKFAIITGNLDGIITSFNEEAERILGYSASEMIGKLSPGVFHDPNEVTATAELLSQEYNTKVPVGFETFVFKARQAKGNFDEREWTYIRKDGTRVPVRLNVTGLFDSKGQLSGFLGIAKDLTEERALFLELERERAKSIRNSKLVSLGEMSAGVAHEINNPLTVISGSIRLLSKHVDNPEKFTAKIETIQKSCDRIARIVGSLRKFSRSADKVCFQSNKLSDIVNEALVLTDAKSKRHATPVTFNCSTDMNVFCDEVEIEQVLVNLINNAIDAVKSKPEKWVKITLLEDADSQILRVMDSGLGIPEDVRAKMFDPFFTTKKVGEGTGLGLSVSKGILDEHKATITVVDDCPNTCFEIRFPKAAMNNAA